MGPKYCAMECKEAEHAHSGKKVGEGVTQSTFTTGAAPRGVTRPKSECRSLSRSGELGFLEPPSAHWGSVIRKDVAGRTRKHSEILNPREWVISQGVRA